MDKLCAVCLEQMDMLTYKDEHESTSTCFKLRCGHAFHTKCIVECLQRANKECPCCNDKKNLDEEMTNAGILINLIKEIRKDGRVKIAMDEYKEAKKELQDTTNQLKIDVLEYSRKRKEELEYENKHKYFLKSISNVKSEMKEVSKEKGPKFQALFTRSFNKCLGSNQYQFERFVLNAYGYKFYKLKYKRIHLNL